jgi:uncharacterized Ntn-hydrolase superfamily protein
MKKLILWVAALALLMPARASATWSIIAIDRATGRVVISSATCAAQSPDELKLVQAIVLPGIGVAAAQAGVDRTHANQKLIFEQMRLGTEPSEIIRMLSQDPRFQSRQFGIIDLKGRQAGHSGTGNSDVKLHLQGTSSDGKFYYSVQGNTIKSDTALIEGARVMREGSQADIVDRVMAAMEVVDGHGGDRRCTCETVPLPGANCTGKTAHVAYILAADKDNPRGRYSEDHPQIALSRPPAVPDTGAVCRGEGLSRCHAPWNDGQYSLYIAVYPSNMTRADDSNPVKTLRSRYDAWKRSRGGAHF